MAFLCDMHCLFTLLVDIRGRLRVGPWVRPAILLGGLLANPFVQDTRYSVPCDWRSRLRVGSGKCPFILLGGLLQLGIIDCQLRPASGWMRDVLGHPARRACHLVTCCACKCLSLLLAAALSVVHGFPLRHALPLHAAG